MHFDWNVILPCAFLKTKMISVVQYKWRIKSATSLVKWLFASKKTDLKNPTLPCGLGLKTFFFSPDNVFWNSCITAMIFLRISWQYYYYYYYYLLLSFSFVLGLNYIFFGFGYGNVWCLVSNKGKQNLNQG